MQDTPDILGDAVEDEPHGDPRATLVVWSLIAVAWIAGIALVRRVLS